MEKRVKHLARNRFAETFGWVGTVALLGSYALLTLNIISGDSLAYHSLILIGATGLAIITYRHQAFQSFIVNVVFGVLAVFAIARLLILA